MPRKRPKGTSEGRLQKLWRMAVIATWNADPLSGERMAERLQCHHLVYRRYWLTRHDWRNGVPLDHNSHRRVHSIEGNMPLLELMTPEHREYLVTLQRWTKPDYLLYSGLSEDEFLKIRQRELERVAEEGVNRRDPEHYLLPEWMT